MYCSIVYNIIILCEISQNAILFYCINIMFIYLFMNLYKFTNLNHG